MLSMTLFAKDLISFGFVSTGFERCRDMEMLFVGLIGDSSANLDAARLQREPNCKAWLRSESRENETGS